MLKTLLFLATAAILVLADEEVVKRAIVRLDANGVNGNITFNTEPDGKLRITGTIIGMPPGMYGFHVHEKGDVTGGCLSAGPHFNPYGKDHGHPEDENRHVGDLGNIVFDQNRIANVDFIDREIKLSGRENIIGRALVLHEKNDDFGKSDHPDSKKTGNAGGRVACGVIGILETQPPTNTASTIVKTSLLALSIFTFIL